MPVADGLLMRSVRQAAWARSIVLLAACEPPEKERDKADAEVRPVGPPGLGLAEVSFEDLRGWRGDDQAAALDPLLRSCRVIAGQPESRNVGPDGMAGTVKDWRAPCAALAVLPPAGEREARKFFENWFVPFEVTFNGETEGTFTGYYEAELKGSWEPDGDYRWPLYRRPPDMVIVNLGKFRADLAGERLMGRLENGELVPYFTRKEIEQGALANEDLAFMWVDDPVDSFILHIQGSGRVILPDGDVQRVGFAAHNGHGFKGIGSIMLERGLIEPGKASMQEIRRWLKANPEEARALMQENPRFIFFQPIEAEGPVGAQGVPLTAERSLAVDARYLPLGAPLWLETTWPGPSEEPLNRLMIAQDVGGAIKGAVRGDFFWGTGEKALDKAGGMKESGRYYLLLPKSVVRRTVPLCGALMVIGLLLVLAAGLRSL